MQFTIFTLFFVVTIASLPTKTNAQLLSGLFTRLLRPVASAACELAQSTLGLQEIATCECDLGYAGILRGFRGNVACETTSQRCLVAPDKFCATGTVEFDLAAGVLISAGFNSDIEACFKVESGLPDGLVELDNDICFTFSSQGLAFDACTVQIGDKSCQKCDICDSGTDFTFDCANIDLETASDLITINGPVITNCIGLSLVPIPANVTIPTNFTI